MKAESTFTPAMNELYREYVALRLRRHFQLMEGVEDEQSDEVEDGLELLWNNLDDVQRRSVDGMGSDLNWLRRHGEPPPKGPKEEDVTESDRTALQDAFTRKDWHTVLHYLRVCAPALMPDSLAYNRAICYHSIGLDAIAALFFDFTADISSGDEFGGAALRSLYRLNPEMAAKRASAIIASERS